MSFDNLTHIFPYIVKQYPYSVYELGTGTSPTAAPDNLGGQSCENLPTSLRKLISHLWSDYFLETFILLVTSIPGALSLNPSLASMCMHI